MAGPADGTAFRDATERDLPAIVAIYNSTIETRLSTADVEPVSVESRREWFRTHVPGRRPLWVVERDTVIEAWFSFRDFYGRAAYGATAEVSAYVHPDRRGRGLGGFLLDAAVDRAPELGLTALVGFVFGHNEASLRLFESRAFERWGRLPSVALLDGTERDLVIVGRRIGNPTESGVRGRTG